MNHVSKIIIIIIIIKDKNEKKKTEERKGEVSGERERVERDILIFFSLFSFFSKIYGDRTVGFRWSKRQSSSML